MQIETKSMMETVMRSASFLFHAAEGRLPLTPFLFVDTSDGEVLIVPDTENVDAERLRSMGGAVRAIRVWQTDSAVIVAGEDGTGCEALVRAILHPPTQHPILANHQIVTGQQAVGLAPGIVKKVN